MALPKLLQKLFTNGGAGDKLNQDIIPDIPYSKVTGAPSVDSALSSTSENPVQNKVIKSALDRKLSTSVSTDKELLLNYGKGGWLTLLGKDFNREDKGGFILATTGPYLAGKPDGSLEWGGKNVLTGNSAGLTVVAESYGSNSWYRKYSDGWIEQGGGVIFTETYEQWDQGGITTRVVTLPLAFSNDSYTLTFGSPDSSAHVVSTSDNHGRTTIQKSATGFTVKIDDRGRGMKVWWYACGR